MTQHQASPDLERAAETPQPRDGASLVLPPAFLGHFDGIRDGKAEGWASYPASPSSPVRVEIWADGQFVALGFADQPGDGKHRFSIPLPATLDLARTHAVSAKIAGEDELLDGSPIATWLRAPAAAALPEGALQFASHGLAIAWARTPDAPATRVEVELLCDGTVVATARADLPRRDLRDRGIGDGAHGVLLPIPDRFADGRPHEIAARIAGTGHTLAGSPLRYVLDEPLSEPAFHAAIIDPAAPGAPPPGKLVRFFIDQAVAAFGRRDYAGSNAMLFRLVLRGLDRTFVHCCIGRNYRYLGDFDAAREWLHRALDDTAPFPWTHYELARLHEAAHEPEAAARELARFLGADHPRPIAESLNHIHRADILRIAHASLATGRQAALALLRLAMQIGIADQPGILSVVEDDLDQNQLDAAELGLARLAALGPADEWAELARARLLIARAQPDAALDFLLPLASGSASAAFKLAVANRLLASGQHRAAALLHRATLQPLARAEPDHAAAVAAIATRLDAIAAAGRGFLAAHDPAPPPADLPRAADAKDQVTFLLRYAAGRIATGEAALAAELRDRLEGDAAWQLFHAPAHRHARGAPTPADILPAPLAALRAQLIAASGIFDAAYYLSQLSEPLPDASDPIAHYLAHGWLRGQDPHPLFSVRHYLARYPDVRASGIEPLTHYIENGSAEMRDPHPLFLNFHYASQHDAPAAAGQTWLGHFLAATESTTSPHPIFDVGEYARRCLVDSGSARAALLHYLTTGWRTGHDPSPLFQAAHYAAQLGTGTADIEPYTHYLLFGVPRCLGPHPLFDARHYRAQVPGMEPWLDPLVHYLWTGEASGLSPSPLFDVAFYRDRYGTRLGHQGALWHYLTQGANQACRPNRFFRAAPPSGALLLEQAAASGVAALVAEPAAADSPTAPTIAPSAAAELPDHRYYPGRRAHRPGRPTILLVAHIASTHLFGGERSFLDMVQGLDALDVNLCIALPRNVPDYTNAIRRQCEHVYVFRYGWWRKDEPAMEPARDMFRHILRKHDVHAVHANTIMLRECLQAARDCGVLGIVHVRELITHDQDLCDIIGLSPAAIIAEVHARTDWIVGNSLATAEAFAKPGMTSIVPNMIDTDAMDMPNHRDGATIRFGLISSNLPKKGIHDLAALAAICAETAPNAEFLLIGPENADILAMKARQQAGELPGRIVFAGYAASPRDAVAQVNVVLSLSHFAESFGRTVIEAMAARRPVITYAWGALPELVDHGRTGFLAPYKDVQAVARFVETLCHEPGRIEAMGEEAKHVAVARYGTGSYNAAFRKAYLEILPQQFAPPDRAEPIVRHARRPGLMQRRTDLRIAYFCWHFPVPSETFVLNELRLLVAAGEDVVVFCREIPYRNFTPDFPIRFERVATWRDLAARLEATGRTIVHAHFVYPTVTDMVWPACDAAKIPFTFIAHAQDIFVKRNDERNRLAEIGASPWCLRMFTLSRFHHDFVASRGFPAAKIVINPNAIDTERFTAVAEAGNEHRPHRRVVAVHRFVAKKGLVNLIKAAPLVADLGLHIDIYGWGDEEAEYRRTIAELGLRNVTVHGQVSQAEVAEVLRTADLSACPCIQTEDGNMDGIPTALVESMAANVPVLTTAIAGIPDLVQDGVSGIICDPTPEGVADGIRRFYAMHPLHVRAMIEEGRARATTRHDAHALVDTLRRVWSNTTVDIVIVAWNNLAELRMVVDAILANTATPYHLIVCDNRSEKENIAGYLDALWAREDHVTIVHNHRNAMVGPGTNLAMAQGNSDIVIYMCGREGVSFANGWERSLLAPFAAPDVGLAGSLGYSPSYLTGASYPTGVKLFGKFRNQDFAAANPDRPFRHIQGGLFAMRRAMVDAIGGFSEDVPHDFTDVEYSYHAESQGWRLAEAEGVLALFNKTRPSLSQRFRDDIQVAHPVLPAQLATFRAVAAGRLCHCNMCDWFGPAFEAPALACPSCASLPQDRSLFRWLSDSTSMFRRLPALAAGLEGRISEIWAQQFQGVNTGLATFLGTLRSNGRLPNNPGRMQLAALRIGDIADDDITRIARELARLLGHGAPALIQIEEMPIDRWDALAATLGAAMAEAGFAADGTRRYASQALRYAMLPIHVFAKPERRTTRGTAR